MGCGCCVGEPNAPGLLDSSLRLATNSWSALLSKWKTSAASWPSRLPDVNGAFFFSVSCIQLHELGFAAEQQSGARQPTNFSISARQLGATGCSASIAHLLAASCVMPQPLTYALHVSQTSRPQQKCKVTHIMIDDSFEFFLGSAQL